MYFLGCNRLLWAKYKEQNLCWLMPKILSNTSPIIILAKGVVTRSTGKLLLVLSLQQLLCSFKLGISLSISHFSPSKSLYDGACIRQIRTPGMMNDEAEKKLRRNINWIDCLAFLFLIMLCCVWLSFIGDRLDSFTYIHFSRDSCLNITIIVLAMPRMNRNITFGCDSNNFLYIFSYLT